MSKNSNEEGYNLYNLYVYDIDTRELLFNEYFSDISFSEEINWMKQNIFYIEDINFDGYLDFRFLKNGTHYDTRYDIHDKYYKYYFWNNDKKCFIEDTLYEYMTRPVFDPVNKQITSISFSGNTDISNIYNYNDRNLEFAVRKYKYYLDNDEVNYQSKFIDGELVFTADTENAGDYIPVINEKPEYPDTSKVNQPAPTYISSVTKEYEYKEYRFDAQIHSSLPVYTVKIRFTYENETRYYTNLETITISDDKNKIIQIMDINLSYEQIYDDGDVDLKDIIIIIEDMNFDGYLDFRIRCISEFKEFYDSIGYTFKYKYFLYNSDKERFIIEPFMEEFYDPSFDPVNKTLYTHVPKGMDLDQILTYKYCNSKWIEISDIYSEYKDDHIIYREKLFIEDTYKTMYYVFLLPKEERYRHG